MDASSIAKKITFLADSSIGNNLRFLIAFLITLLSDSYEVIEENRQLIADNRKLIGRSLREIKDSLNERSFRGVYVTDYIRAGTSVAITEDLVVEKNDVIQLTGTAQDINRVEKHIGKRMSSATMTDFIVLGFGMVQGFLIGLISFKIAGILVTIGSGVGCLISGLLVGWLRSRNPHLVSSQWVQQTLFVILV